MICFYILFLIVCDILLFIGLLFGYLANVIELAKGINLQDIKGMFCCEENHNFQQIEKNSFCYGGNYIFLKNENENDLICFEENYNSHDVEDKSICHEKIYKSSRFNLGRSFHYIKKNTNSMNEFVICFEENYNLHDVDDKSICHEKNYKSSRFKIQPRP